MAAGLALALTFSVGIGVGRFASPSAGDGDRTTPGPTASSTAAGEAFDLISQAWEILHDDYVGADELDDTALAYEAIEGLANAVGDTGHTSFLTPEERTERAAELSGSYVGIGVRIDPAEDGRPVVVGVFRGSPAEAAGLRTGDLIVSVEGRATDGHKLDEIAGWIRGEAGSTVSITIRSGSDGPLRELRIVRAEVVLDAVSWSMIPGTRTAFLRLEQFSEGSGIEITAGLGEIRVAGADRVIFDLRGNSGGYVDEALAVASQFLAGGQVFVERDASGKETGHDVLPGGTATDLPLVVLIDGGTASAGEIVAGAIQDAGRGQLVGVTTFGTGTVLGEFPLADGSALRVGTVEWLTPAGRRIWHEGIVPDVVIERPADALPLVPDDVGGMTVGQINRLTDPQLARALTLVASAVEPAG